MRKLPDPRIDLANRKPVWGVWSDLYLDTEISPKDEAGIARLLARSPYNTKQLKTILWTEVHPACFLNLIDILGVWEGFDLEWLAERILARRARIFRIPYFLLPSFRQIAPPAGRILSAVEAMRVET